MKFKVFERNISPRPGEGGSSELEKELNDYWNEIPSEQFVGMQMVLEGVRCIVITFEKELKK